MALIRHSTYILFSALCCLVLIVITVITVTIWTSACICLLCDQSIERRPCQLPDVLAKGVQVSQGGPVSGVSVNWMGRDKELQKPKPKCSKKQQWADTSWGGVSDVVRSLKWNRFQEVQLCFQFEFGLCRCPAVWPRGICFVSLSAVIKSVLLSYCN